MPVPLYMDVHVHRAITDGLRRRGVDVLTAQEDGTNRFDDDELLNRSTELGRVLFTFDDDLLREAQRRQSENVPFAGVVYAHLLRISIGPCIDDLELMGPELQNRMSCAIRCYFYRSDFSAATSSATARNGS